MKRFTSFDGTEIAYLDVGSGPVVVLHHGFAVNHEVNWVAPGIVDALMTAGARVLAVDARYHGRSGQRTATTVLGHEAMARDVSKLLDHVELDDCCYVGYSMGAFVGSYAAGADRRIGRLVLSGVGSAVLARKRRSTGTDGMAEALEADDPSSNTPVGQIFRALADMTGSDRHALAAHHRTVQAESPADISAITVPTLVLTGHDDDLLGDPRVLADALEDATLHLTDGDHLTALRDPDFASALVRFALP